MAANDLRTEADLYAALDELSHGAPQLSDVLPDRWAGTRPGRKPGRWLAPVAAVAIVLAVVLGLVHWGATSNHTATPPASDVNELVGIEWRVQAVGATLTAPTGTLRIDPTGRFTQTVPPCGNVRGRLTAAATTMTIEQVHTILGLCPYIPHEPHTNPAAITGIRAMFHHVITWTVHDGHLTLHQDGLPDIRYVRAPGSPERTRQWTYRGVGISVPADWAANAQRCGTPIKNTVLFPSPDDSQLCLVTRPADVTAIEFRAGASSIYAPPKVRAAPAAMLDGVQVLEHTSRPTSGPYQGLTVFELQIPSHDTTVVISSPRRSTALQLENAIYLVR